MLQAVDPLMAQAPGASSGPSNEGPTPSVTGDWIASFDLRLDRGSNCTILPSTYERIASELDGLAPIFRVSTEFLGLTFEVQAPDLATAQVTAGSVLEKVLRLLRVADGAAVAVNVRSASAPGPQLPSTAPDPWDADAYVGVGEAADLLGVTKQRIHQLTKTDRFPRPLFRLRATPVWSRGEIERFGRNRQSRSAI